MVSWLSLVLGVLIATVHVNGKPSTKGFISIDCGVKEGYTDETTNITYTTDNNFIQTGKNYNISNDYISYAPSKQYHTVRSFSNGHRNCYALKPVIKAHKYLIRASFMYGNYDGKNSIYYQDNPIVFDLHIGVNFWKKVNITDTGKAFIHEAIVVALANTTSVCLIKSGNSTPFISSLELRPLKAKLYPLANASQFLVPSYRFDFGREFVIARPPDIRYPNDRYDRIWKPILFNVYWPCILINSTVTTNPSDPFEAPSAVLQTAVTSWFDHLSFYWNTEVTNVGYYAVLHFSEIEDLPAGAVREFNIFVDNELWHGKYRPRYLVADAISRTSPLIPAVKHLFVINNTRNATLSPILNALELFYSVRVKEVSTELENVDAMLAIKAEYQVTKNWMGDPCSPRDYAWDGLSCNYGANPLRIVALNLSSNGFVGTISTSFSMLTAIKSLDLSYNNLTGSIPNFLANMQSLRVLNLTGNHFTGVIPDALLKKSLSGSLILRY